jgi:heat shock protein HslJ
MTRPTKSPSRTSPPTLWSPARGLTRLLALVVLFTLVVAACGGDDDDSVSASGPSDATNPDDSDPTRSTGAGTVAGDPFGETEWILTLGTVDGTELGLLASHPITLERSSEGVNGTAACNGYFGTIVDGAVLFEGFGVTEMACDPPESMELESAYLIALGRVTTAVTDAGALVLSGSGVELRFDAVAPTPDADLTNTAWVLDTIIDGDIASSTVAGTTATLRFEADVMAGSDGCNSFNGGYELDGLTLRPGALASTARGCIDDDVARLSEAVGSVLFSQPSVEISGDRLTLTAPDGKALVYRVG